MGMAALSTETLLQELVDTQQRVIKNFFANIEFDQWEAVLQACLSCTGKIVFCGVGKSGFVAEKLAATFSSTGTEAICLHYANALHGDIAAVSAGDLAILISKSGESDELIGLVPFLRNRSVRIVSVVCSASSRLAQQSDLSVCLRLESELCPFNLAPTSSPTLQMLFGDILAVALMRAKNLTKEEYGRNHPAGRIGRRLLYKVQDLMLSGEDVPYCFADQTLGELLVELSSKRCGCLVVVDDQKHLLGIFTDGDLRRGLETLGAGVLELRVGDRMTRAPRTISRTAAVTEAMQIMERDPDHPVMVLPVVDDSVCTGLIKMHDIIQAGL